MQNSWQFYCEACWTQWQQYASFSKYCIYFVAYDGVLHMFVPTWSPHACGLCQHFKFEFENMHPNLSLNLVWSDVATAWKYVLNIQYTWMIVCNCSSQEWASISLLGLYTSECVSHATFCDLWRHLVCPPLRQLLRFGDQAYIWSVATEGLLKMSHRLFINQATSAFLQIFSC